jgi:hypothetical protein
MPSINISVPHQLGEEEAASRVKNLLAKVKDRHQDKISNLEEKWEGNQLSGGFTTYGFNIKGTVKVEPNEVKINGSLPIAAMMFKGKIEQTVKEELTRLLS